MADSTVAPKVAWPYYNKQNIDREAGRSNTLGKDQFMKILISQLSNQDPLQPLQDKEFITQMAQFTALEQTMNMASEIRILRQSLSWGAQMIGKTVTWLGEASNGQEPQEKSGVISAIVMKDGVQYARVGEEEIPLERILSIANTEGSQ